MGYIIIGFLLGAGTMWLIARFKAKLKGRYYESAEGLSLELLEGHRQELLRRGLFEIAKDFEGYIEAYKSKKSLFDFFSKYQIKYRTYKEKVFPDHPFLGGYDETREYYIEVKYLLY